MRKGYGKFFLPRVNAGFFGWVAELLAKLAEAKVNETACDAVAAGAGRYGALLWVKPQEVQKAAKVLGTVKEERPKGAEVGAGASQATPEGNAAA